MYSKYHDLIYYSGDAAAVAFQYFDNRPIYSLPGRAEWGAIHADPVSGQIYQLHTEDENVLGPTGTLAKVACLDGDLSIHRMMSLERPIPITGYYAYIGWKTLAIRDANNNWAIVELECGRSDLKVKVGGKWNASHAHNICEHQYQGGVLEEHPIGTYWILYPHQKTMLKRQIIPGGEEPQKLGYSGSEETCSFALDLRRRRWYYHREEVEKLDGPEPLFSCPAVLETAQDLR